MLNVSPSFAQEITPAVTSASQVKLQAQGSVFENFMKNLIPEQFRQTSNTLKNVNCSNLPSEACGEINLGISPTVSAGVKTQSTSNEADNKNTVSNAAGQYVVASGIHTPSEVSNASTNIFSNFISQIANAFGSIFDRGEKEAKNYAGTALPSDVTAQSFTQTAPANSDFAAENFNATSNVLGIQNQPNSAMDKALPLLQCADLPAGLCNGNKPNFVTQP